MLARIIGFSFLALLLLAGCQSGTDSGAGVDRIPNRELLNKLIQSRGKVVVLNFFASWCAPCKIEIPQLMEVRKEYSDEEVLILGVSLEESGREYKKFVDKTGFNYEVFLGGEDVAQAFGVYAFPTLVIYGKDGRLALNHAGVVEKNDLKRKIDSLLRR